MWAWGLITSFAIWLTTVVDGGWFDITSLAIAIVYAGSRKIRFYPAGKWVCRQTSIDIANGVALFPLFMLAISCIATKAVEQLHHSNPIILSVAGIMALFSVLEENEDQPESA